MKIRKNIFHRINVVSLNTVGVLNIDVDEQYNNWKRVHSVYCTVIFIYFCLFVLSEIIEVFNILGVDLFQTVASLGVLFLYISGIVKVCVVKSNKFQKLMQEIRKRDSEILDGKDESIKKIYMKYVTLNYNSLRFIITFGGITIIPFYLAPIIEQIEEPLDSLYDIVNGTVIYRPRPLPFVAWFPFNRYKYYYCAFLLHIIAGIVGCSITVTTDGICFSMMIYIRSQIEILQHRFREFKYYAEEYKQKNRCSLESAIEKIVFDVITEHKTIIKYVEDLNNCMKFLMLLDFALASLQMAMLGFQMIISGLGVKQLFAAEYLSAMLTQLFLFYWHANEVIFESQQVSTAIYNSDWFTCSPKIKKAFLLVMMRSSKPLTLKVGPFYSMSTATALSILKTAYSYVALLRQTLARK